MKEWSGQLIITDIFVHLVSRWSPLILTILTNQFIKIVNVTQSCLVHAKQKVLSPCIRFCSYIIRCKYGIFFKGRLACPWSKPQLTVDLTVPKHSGSLKDLDLGQALETWSPGHFLLFTFRLPNQTTQIEKVLPNISESMEVIKRKICFDLGYRNPLCYVTDFCSKLFQKRLRAKNKRRRRQDVKCYRV